MSLLAEMSIEAAALLPVRRELFTEAERGTSRDSDCSIIDSMTWVTLIAS